jgi:metal-responsive CopG/Arc/MetJ family transcriptional regulator
MRRNMVASVSLPVEIVRESAKAAKELGKSRSELVADAMKAYLSLHKFRKLQSKLQGRRSNLRVASEEQVDRLVHEYRREKKG